MTAVRPALGLAVLAALACARPAPRAIVLGEEPCAHCHMTVADPRFGAELVTRTGKVFIFDDAACLAAFVEGGTVAPEAVHSLWVADFLAPDSLRRVEEVVFLRSEALRTPMAGNVAAVRAGPRADSLQAALGAERLAWADVAALAAQGAGH